MDGWGVLTTVPTCSRSHLSSFDRDKKANKKEGELLQDYLGQIEMWNPGAVTPLHKTPGTLESERSETDLSIKLFNLPV